MNTIIYLAFFLTYYIDNTSRTSELRSSICAYEIIEFMKYNEFTEVFYHACM
jgi:hypothetical protein